MAIPDKYFIQTVTRKEYLPWLLKKHYAHRVPGISHAFGLYNEDSILCGVCTFGMPANYMEMKAWEPFQLLELNRLVVNDGLPKNVLSFFVSSTLKQLPIPTVVISYADITSGHYGYIYQATNWLFTGFGGEKHWILKDGSVKCRRHHEKISSELIDRVEKTQKARYYMFVGTKKHKKQMLELLRYPILPYPKGDNQRYDASFKPEIQQVMF